MKNKLESFAIMLVGLLSLLVVYFIVQYNLIDDSGMIDKISYKMPEVKKVSKEEKTHSYLKNLEGYTDVEVEVDPTQEGTANRVEVQSEEVNNAITEVLEDKEKKDYIQNLEEYSNKKNEDISPQKQESNEPKRLKDEEIVDEIGLAIGKALEDI